MAASYKTLFKLMIDREMKSKDLASKAHVSVATLAKMKKDGASVNKADFLFLEKSHLSLHRAL